MSTWPQFAEDEIEAVHRVLRTGRVNYWTGEEGREFEREYAEHCRVAHAVAVANGTVGLELALHSLGIGPAAEVIVPPRTFVATASCVVARGAVPVFADVDLTSQNLTAQTISRAVTPRTRAIIVVHLAGWPCDMEPIMALARDRGLKVIEDCAQANGAADRGRPVGGIGDVGVFSFCQDKIITTGGEGGMLVTNDRPTWERAWSYKDHGKSYAATRTLPQGSGPTFRWVHDSFGTNWRLTEMQAAIGRLQLRKLPSWVESRRRNASVLAARFAPLKLLRVTTPSSQTRHSYYKYYAFVRPERLAAAWTRDRIVAAINTGGAKAFTGSCSEIYREKAFISSCLAPADRLPCAQELGETSLMFQVDPSITPAQLERTAEVVERVAGEALGR